MTTLSFPLPNAPTLYAPLPALSEIQRDQAVARIDTPDGGVAYVVTRYADVRTVLVDPRFSRAGAAASTTSAADFGLGALATDSIIGMDPPEHTRLRRLVARAFTARRVEQLRPGTAKIVDELIDAMIELPRPADLVEHFSLALPVRVICEMLGVPAGDRATFHGWSDTLLGGPGSDPRVMGAALQAMAEYFGGLIAVKRATPQDDLMTALIAARDEQDKLTEEELVRLSLGILIGGHETTANQIAMILLTLRHHPEQDARLRADPSLIPGAVEELMRFVQLGDGATSLPRVATEDVELSGVTIPKGAIVLPFLLVVARMSGLVAQVRDQAAQLEALAHNDGLTGVPNRRAWDIQLQREMTRARRSGAEICVALLDLDHFKRFNDSHGHQAGDRLLKEASAAWRSLLRPGDTLARYGGEEFGVVLVGASPQEAVRVLDRLREVTPRGQTFSAGLVRWDGVEAADEVVGRADEALHHAKHDGRNRVHLADAVPTTRDIRILA